ncbi:MAG: hypothetical protein AMXMBFR4_11580 [Candidatus Hydrogenedentota bacterium]
MSRNRMPRRDFMKTAVVTGAGIGALSAGPAAHAAETPAAGQQVPRKQLGTTGAEIPILLMGGSQRFDPTYDKRLHRAFQLGINYIDTAQTYAGGQSQKTIAPFIKQIGDRKKLWITSKVRLYNDAATPANYTSNLDKCLADLETDYLDMFFMHMIRDERMLDPEFIKMGDDIKKSGKARFFGFSCHDGNVAELLSLAAKTGGIDAIMFRYNFRQYGDVKLNQAIDACKQKGIGLIAMKTQASVPEDQEKVVEFKSKNFTLGQAKLKSVWADERIDAAVSGLTSVQLVQENAEAAMSPMQLSMEEFTQLNRLAALTAGYHCKGCNQICESRINGQLRIADALRYLMYYESYGDPEMARLLYNALPPLERDFEGIDLSAAAIACPQGIDIESRLRAARQYLLA